MRATSRGAAPNAIRRPISRVRRFTAYAMTPYRPTAPIPSATSAEATKRPVTTRLLAVSSKKICSIVLAR